MVCGALTNGSYFSLISGQRLRFSRRRTKPAMFKPQPLPFACLPASAVKYRRCSNSFRSVASPSGAAVPDDNRRCRTRRRRFLFRFVRVSSVFFVLPLRHLHRRTKNRRCKWRRGSPCFIFPFVSLTSLLSHPSPP